MEQLKAVHALFTTSGLHRNIYAISKIVSFCATSPSGDVGYATLLFSRLASPNPFIYNTIIKGMAMRRDPYGAIFFFKLMCRDLGADHYALSFVLGAFSEPSTAVYGRQMHTHIVKGGYLLHDVYIQISILRMYCDCLCMVDARKLFDEMPQRDVVLWSVVLSGHVRGGDCAAALQMFQEMQVSGVQPDEFTVATMIASCARCGALQQGRWIHEYVINKNPMNLDVVMNTALVDMYAKCGCIEEAVRVFEHMEERNVLSWTAMIGGFAVHGLANYALHCFHRMERSGIVPDDITILALLSACNHAGLGQMGFKIFNSMQTNYGISPKHEHYGCMVDLLCRAGCLYEALDLINSMPMKPLASVWGSLLSASRSHGNIGLAEHAVAALLDLEPEGDGFYVQLSNVYANAQRLGDAARARKKIGNVGIKKTPGCSLIEVEGMVAEFVAGDESHPLSREIYEALDLLYHDLANDSFHSCYLSHYGASWHQ
uniref:Pentatricopeptide repeat-containing protein n=2 Tax=Nymphaea colorata TaxID=210225 RepID=A0A5K1EBC5_9MAGN